MISQGGDGLSQGDLTNGMMQGTPMLHYVPLHLLALDCWELSIWSFLRDITPTQLLLTYLNPGDWYTLPFDQDGVFVWAPPPAVADAMVEQMAEAINE